MLRSERKTLSTCVCVCVCCVSHALNFTVYVRHFCLRVFFCFFSAVCQSVILHYLLPMLNHIQNMSTLFKHYDIYQS
jgi:hypothetical protein